MWAGPVLFIPLGDLFTVAPLFQFWEVHYFFDNYFPVFSPPPFFFSGTP